MLTTAPRAALPQVPREAPAGTPRSRERPGHPDGGTLGATAACALLTLGSAGGLVRVFSGDQWVVSVIFAALAGHGVSWVMRRWRVPQVPAFAVIVGVVWLVSIWAILGASTRYGIPTGATWSQFNSALAEVRRDFNTSVAPITPTPGWELLAALGTGLVALVADWILFRGKSALAAAAPAFALFIICCTSGQGSGRQWAVLIEVTTLIVFLLANRSTGSAPVWFAGDSSRTSAWVTRVGALTGGLALLTAVAVVPLLGGQDGIGLLGWRSGIGPGSGGPRIVANPIVDLRTRLQQLQYVPVFQVSSDIPSYWRLTSLDAFTGDTWISTGSYRGFGSRLPGAFAAPPGTRTVVEHFAIENLESVWLPAAFTPIAVNGTHDVSYDPSSNSLITSLHSTDGFTYTVTSYQYLSTLTAADLEAAPALGQLGSMSTEIKLPPSVQTRVLNLAHQITAGKTTEYDKAVAIQQYLRSAPFSYSLNPPFDGPGTMALYNFLFVTHRGYCQQFAGSYAVLARAAGLPTRLAVGFATGSDIGTNEYQVYDADAHTWPEVWFGRGYGWIPFEPTPTFFNPSASHYDPTASGPGGPSRAPGEPLPNAPKSGPGASTQHTGSPTTTAPANVGTGSTRHGHRSSFLLSPIFLIFVISIAWVGFVVGGRRLRWIVRRARGGRLGGAGRVLAVWADVGELLAWRGISRREHETDDEYAARAARVIETRSGEPSPWLSRGVRRLARLAREAAFAPAVPSTAAGEAEDVATDIHRALFRSATARQLVAWTLVPRPGRRRRLRAS